MGLVAVLCRTLIRSDYRPHKDVMRIGTLLLLLTARAAAVFGQAVSEPTPVELRLDLPVQLFLQICATSYGDARAVEAQAERFGMTELPEDLARGYLVGNSGRAWYLEKPGEAFAVTFLDAKLCTLFIHQGDTGRIKASLEAWLPPENSGITYKVTSVPVRGGLESTQYLLQYPDGQEQWILTVNTEQESAVRAVISYQDSRGSGDLPIE
jgi:hypothetical protein